MLGGNITFSVETYLQNQLKPSLGGDIVISHNKDLPEQEIRQKYESTFEISKTVSFYTTFMHDSSPLLVELIYKNDNFPFYNYFEYETLFASWTLIVSKNIYQKYGDTIEIFWKKYMVRWVITKQPVWNISLYASQNKIYLPLSEFSSQLSWSNSRLEYMYYLVFRWKYDEAYKNILRNDSLFQWARIRSLGDRNDSISDTTDRFYIFIHFFYFLIFALTFFIIILSLETFFKKTQYTIGLLTIFWLQKRKIFLYYLLMLWIIFLWGFLFAWILCVIVMYVLGNLYDFFTLQTQIFVKSFFILLILFWVGMASPIYKLAVFDIASLIKNEGMFSYFSLKNYLMYILFLWFWFLWIYLLSWMEIWISFLMSVGSIFLLILSYISIQNVLKKFFSFLQQKYTSQKSFYKFDAIRSTVKPGNVSFLIIFSAMISFIALFVFYVFSWSFLSYLSNITKDSNDTFVLNVQPKDMSVIQKYFSQDEIFEIVTLKIKTINNTPLEEFLWVSKVPRQFGREFYSTTNVLENKILQWNNLTSGWVSVDKEFWDELGLKLGDTITFSVAGLEQSLRVENFREAVRNGTNPFFFFQLYPKDFQKYPKSYILSYKESEKQHDLEEVLLSQVSQSLTFISMKETIDMVTDIAYKILSVVYLCLGYIFMFTVLSFLVSLYFLLNFKIKKMSYLYLLGWVKRKLQEWLHFEFMYLIGIALFLSILVSSLILYVFFYFIPFFSMNYWYFFYWVILYVLMYMSLYGIFKIFFVKRLHF